MPAARKIVQNRTAQKKAQRKVPSIRLIRQKAFLRAYIAYGTISGASRATGIVRSRHYGWMENDPTYTEKFATAHEEAVDRAEEELRRRGIAGIDEPVFYKGEQTASKRVYSDACLIFYLKGRRGDVFRDRFEHSGPGGGPIQTEDLTGLSDAELKKQISELLGTLKAK